jgi:hypothetical protein
MGLLQQTHHADGLQEVEEIIQPRAFIEPIHAIDQLLAVRVARHPGIVAPGDLSIQPPRQVLCDLVWCLPHGSPSSLVFVNRKGDQLITEKRATFSLPLEF